LESLFATRLIFAGTDPDATRTSVLSDVAKWGWRGDDESTVDLLTTEAGETENEGYRFSWETLKADGDPGVLTSARLQHGDDTHRGIEWSTTIDVVSGAGEVRVSLQIQRRATQMQIAPAPVRLRRPHIVPTLIQHHDLTCGDGIPLSSIERRLEPGDIDDFITDMLTLPQRALPTLIFSIPPGATYPATNARTTADELAGLAHVYVLSGQLSWERLREALGHSAAVPRSGARLFWPGFGTEGDSVRHPFWGRAALAPKSGRRPFPRYLFERLAPLSVLRVPPDPMASIVRRGDADRRRAEFAEQSAKRAVGDALEEIATVEDLEKEIERLREKVDEQQGLLEEKDAVILRHEENLRSIAVAVPSPQQTLEPQERDEVETWPDVAEFCEILAGSGSFCLTDHARDQIPSCEYPDPARMWRHLLRLSDAAEAFRKADGQIKERFDKWVHTNFGIEVANHDIGLREAGGGSFEFEEATYSRERHVKVDDVKAPSECGRIYFALDTEKKRIIVDHIGLHL
jgi:hypothetical protein